MAILEHPTTPGFREVSWAMASVVAKSESPFSLKAQVYKWSGQKRFATLALPIMTIEQARPWQAFFLRLNGLEGSFYLSDRIVNSPSSPPKGSGLIKGASQLGGSIESDGWKVNTQIFSAGEIVSISDRLHTVLEDVYSDSSGNATLSLWPQITTAPSDNSAIEWQTPRGVFRLLEIPEHTWNVARLCDGITFSVEEVL